MFGSDLYYSETGHESTVAPYTARSSSGDGTVLHLWEVSNECVAKVSGLLPSALSIKQNSSKLVHEET